MQHGGLGGEALQLGVHKLQAGELGAGLGREAVEVVVAVVDFDAGHGVLLLKGFEFKRNLMFKDQA